MATRPRARLRAAAEAGPQPDGHLPAPASGPARPPYARVKHYLKSRLLAGHWAPGARLPTEAELVAQFSVSRMTVHRALRELQGEGLVDRRQGVGSFAARTHKLSSTLTLRDLQDEIESRGHLYRASVQLQRAEAAPAALAERLGLVPGARIFHTLIVHHAQGVPLQCEDRYVNPASAPQYLEIDFSTITPTRYLLEVAPQWEAEVTIEAGHPTAREADLLAIDRDAPCLIVIRRSVSGGVPVTLVRLVHPGASYALESRFSP